MTKFAAMKFIKAIVFSLWMLALSAILLPDFLQLALHHHEHTEDVHFSCCAQHFEEEHHHCLELDFYVLSLYFSPRVSVEFEADGAQSFDTQLEEFYWVDQYPTFLRGPPAATC